MKSSVDAGETVGGKTPKKRSSMWRCKLNPVEIGMIAVVIAFGVGGYFLAAPIFTTPNNYPFQCLGNAPVVYHVHPYLRIVIDGRNVTIPAAIGIDNAFFANGAAGGGPNSCFEPVHTHDASGIIHIESESNRNYTLGDFFTIWRDTFPTVTINGVSKPVAFNSTDILGFNVDSTHRLDVLVDGEAYQGGDPTRVVIDTLDYCSTATTGPPCFPTALGPLVWNGQIGTYPYGNNHTIVIQYSSTSVGGT